MLKKFFDSVTVTCCNNSAICSFRVACF